MSNFEIFGLQFLASLLVYALVARWYIAPRLASLSLAAALQPLLLLHATRTLGMTLLVDAVVGPEIGVCQIRDLTKALIDAACVAV